MQIGGNRFGQPNVPDMGEVEAVYASTLRVAAQRSHLKQACANECKELWQAGICCRLAEDLINDLDLLQGWRAERLAKFGFRDFPGNIEREF